MTVLAEKTVPVAAPGRFKPYPKYKDSGVEWLGKVPANWPITRLKYNSYMKGRIGWQNLRSDEFTDEGPFLITGMHFKLGDVDWDACYHITEERYLMAPEIMVQADDLLITKDGTIGKVAHIRTLPGKASLNSHLLLLRPLQKDSYFPRFLYHFLNSPVFQHYVSVKSTGTTFQGVSQESIENFSVLIPSFPEQKAIASFLDCETAKIDALINEIPQVAVEGNSAISRFIKLLQEHRSALITAAITGKIDVRDPA